jgi:hypothetical protein
VISLVALPQSTGPVSFLLETWNTKFGGLLDQASSSQPPQSFLATNTNIFEEPSTKSFVKKILSTPAFVKQLAAQKQTIAAKGT